MSNARNIAALSTVEVGATADQTKADLNAIGVSGGRKNLIINGGMQVSQRGDYAASPVSAVSSEYSIDRWNTWKATVNATQQLLSATINGVVRKTFKIISTSTGTGHIGFNQRIETQDFPIGGSITVSCWMKSNNSFARLRQNNVANIDSDSPKHSGNGGWEFMSWTLDTTGTLATASSINFGVICFESGNVAINTGDYIEVADFQVEAGSVATDFEHRSYGEELALCQRYYQILDFTRSQLGVLHRATSSGAGLPYAPFSLTATMRAYPSMTTSGTWGTGGDQAGTPILYETSYSNVTLRGNNGSIVAGGSQWLRGGFCNFDAEL